MTIVGENRIEYIVTPLGYSTCLIRAEPGLPCKSFLSSCSVKTGYEYVLTRAQSGNSRWALDHGGHERQSNEVTNHNTNSNTNPNTNSNINSNT